MATNFPGSQDSFTNPSSGSSLSSPSHSQQHADVNDAVEAIQGALLDGSPLKIDDANNRVGVGTASPTATFEVSGAALFDNVYGESSANWNFGQLQLTREASNTSNTKIVSVMLDGDTNSSTDLYSNVNFILRTDSAPTTGSTSTGLNAGLEITAPDSVRLGTGSAERMRIDALGNVGIGTTSPAGALDVNGKIHLTGGTNRYIEHRSGNNDILYSSDAGDFYRQDIANSSHQFFTGNTERLMIDSAGNVTTPYQPAFWAGRSTNQTNVNNSAVDMNFTYQNIGNHFNTSTGQFVAPTAGTYLFNVGIYSTAGQSQFWFNVNGVRQTSIMLVGSNTTNNANSGIFYLNANDAVDLILYTNSTNVTVYANGLHTYWKGTLLG